MITGKKLGNVLLGDKLDDAQIHTALEFINGLTEDGIKIFSEVNVGNTDNLMAYTRDGISVHLRMERIWKKGGACGKYGERCQGERIVC